MKPSRSLLTGLLWVLTLALSAVSAELGDPAAPLQIAEWVKGKPVDLAADKGKKIFVVEFWATWCGPCRASIPHLTEMQKKFKDKNVVFIGVSVWENDQAGVKDGDALAVSRREWLELVAQSKDQDILDDIPQTQKRPLDGRPFRQLADAQDNGIRAVGIVDYLP